MYFEPVFYFNEIEHVSSLIVRNIFSSSNKDKFILDTKKYFSVIVTTIEVVTAAVDSLWT